MKTKKCSLIKICEDVWIVKEDDTHDLMYSQDDDDRNGKGYYWHKVNGSSQSFTTMKEAINAYKNNKVTF